LPLAGGREALLAYFEDKALGSPGRRRFQEQERAAHCGVARLLNVSVSDVALLSSSSEALNVFANSVDWRPGDEVLVSDLEFPSGVLVWLRLRERGVRNLLPLRAAPSRSTSSPRQSFPATRRLRES
jgi:selenocysteine lyase/cysteine desulfurase